jgi:hypothetical protein
MHTNRWSAFLTLLLILLAGAITSAADAQSNTGTILGSVQDETGAAVPDALIIVKNAGTGESRTVKSDGSGAFNVPDLQVGHYTIAVSRDGFSTFQISDTELQLAERLNINPVLHVGAVTDKVTVIATEAPLLNTTSSSVGQVIDTNTVQNMPLNGRNFWQLTQLTPGVSYIQGGQNIPTGGTSIRASAVNVNVNGLSPSWTGWYLDGGNITEFQLGGTIIQPNVDALQEFKVESGNMGADYGHSPTVINATLKSGTNKFHGTAYEFIRNNAADAKNYFYVPPPGTNQRNEPLHRNQFGFVVGGPILKDKTFFFLDAQETLYQKQQIQRSVVFSDAERGGNFQDQYGTTQKLFAPTSRTSARVPLAFNGNPNTIDPSTFSGPSRYLLQFMPHANQVIGTTSYASVTNSLKQQLGQGDIRVDQKIFSRDRLVGRYSISDNRERDPNAFPLMGFFPLKSRGQDLMLRETHIFNAKWINEAQFSYYRSFFLFTSSAQGTDVATAAGITGLAGLAPANTLGFPTVNITNYSNFNGQSGNSYPKQNKIRSWQYVDRISYVSGKHEIHFGMENFHNTNTYISGSTSTGTFTFSGKYSGDNGVDFLLGAPQSAQRSYFRSLWGNTANFQSYYVQDNWRTNSSLTVNAGLRWEINPFYNGLQGQVTGYDDNNGKLVLPDNFSLNAEPGTALLNSLFSDRFETTSSQGLPQSVRPTNKFNVAPRLGMAFSPNSQTVIRGAYGMFFLFPDDNYLNNTQNTVPFVASQTVNNTALSATTASTLTFANFFSSQPIVAANPNPGAPCSFGQILNSCSQPSIVSMRLHAVNTYIQEWNAAVQRQFGSRVSLDVAYVGNKTTHMVQPRMINAPQPGAGTIQTRRPRAQWGTINDATFDGGGNYNSLQSKLELRNVAGGTVLVSYTYGKCLTDGTYANVVREDNSTLNYYGPCNYDLTHNFVTSYLYALPFGRGRSFGSHMNRLEESVAGGWNLSGIATLQSGLPYTVSISGDQANTGAAGQRPNVVGSPKIIRSPNCWFYDSANPSCAAFGGTNAFATPPQYTYGNGGINSMRADGLVQFDVTLLKQFAITDNTRFELRGSFFNVFNHTTFAAPSSTIASSSTGTVSATLNGSRQVELAGKVYF